MILEQAKINPGGDFAIIPTEAEKAFDNVSFNCLSMVLSNMGFTGPFNHLVKSMYTSPAARLVVTGLLTDQFHLYKGTRQGYLTEQAPLHGIRIGDCELHTALFVDNVLIFSANYH